MCYVWLRYTSILYLLLAVVDDDGAGDEDFDNPLMMLFNEIYNHKDPTGRSVSEPFLRLPSRR